MGMRSGQKRPSNEMHVTRCSRAREPSKVPERRQHFLTPDGFRAGSETAGLPVISGVGRTIGEGGRT